MYETFGKFLKEVWKVGQGDVQAQSRLKATGHLEEGQGSMGGFTVPTQFMPQIMSITMEESIVRPRAHIVTMETDVVEIPTFTDTDHSSNVFGGITVTWPAEAAVLTEKSPSIGSVVLQAKKVAGYCYVSNEFMTDTGLQAESFLTQAFGGAIAYYADYEYINGNGVNRPLGIVNASCVESIPKETGQTADTVVWQNVVKMDAQLLPQSQRNAVWLINPECKTQLYQMEVPSNSTVVVLDLSGRNGMWMFGHEIIPTEKCQEVGTAGDIILVDFSSYVIGDRGLSIAASPDVSFNTDETCFRFILRTDGQPTMGSSITPKEGADALAPVITLASRA